MSRKAKRSEAAPASLSPGLSLRRQLAGFDARSVLSSAAALSLLPENAGAGMRLGVLAEAAASLPESERRPGIRPATIRMLARGSETSRMVAGREDPPEYPVVEPLSFEGAIYRVFSGTQQEELVVRGERLFEAVARLAAAETSWAVQARLLVALVLRLLDTTVARSGVESGAAPRPGIAVETGRLSADLLSAVTWSRDDVEQQCELIGADVAILDPLIMNAGDGTPDADADFGALSRRPLVRFRDGLVVLPQLALRALSHAVLTRAAEAGAIAEMAEAFSDAVAGGVEEALARYLGMSPIHLDLPDASIPSYREQAFMADADLLVLGVVLTDPLTEFEAGDAGGMWDPSDRMFNRVSERLDELVALARSSELRPAEVLVVLVLSAPPGRGYHFGLSRAVVGGDVLPMTPGALDVVGVIKAGHPLTLSRYARSRREFHDVSEVIAFHPLDEYELFDRNDESFYLDDERRYNMVSLEPGSGLPLRQRALRRLNRQSPRWPGNGRPREVMSRYEEISPIFAPRDEARQICRVVRLDGVDVWLLSPPTGAMQPSVRDLHRIVIDAAAFWVWQVSAGLLAAIPSPPSPDLVTLYIEIADPTAWETGDPPAIEPSFADVDTWASRPDASGRLVLRPTLRAALARPDNIAERHLAGRIVEVLLNVLGGEDPGLAIADRIIGEVAPVGQRKMIVLFPDDPARQIGSDHGLPKIRHLSPWAANRNLDEVGAHLASQGRTPGSPGDKDAQAALLNDAVAFWFSELEADVARLAPDGLLEHMLARNEALIRQAALRRVEAPTRVACFGPHSDMAATIQRETRELTIASVAHRFLIEYVAARPPSGQLSLSDARYDRLLALANSVIQYGFESDLTKYELTTTNARILPSGRIGAERQDYERALQMLMTRATAEQIEAAQERFASFWRARPDRVVSPPAAWDAGFRAEFGYTLSDLMDVTASLVNAATEADLDVVTSSRSEVIADIAQRLAWDEGRVEAIIADLSLAPRPTFIPMAGFTPFDAFPWRFNRKLSLLRRPVLLREGDGHQTLSWGWRAILGSGMYMADLLLSGRLDARTQEMQTVKSKLGEEQANEFVAEVAAVATAAGLRTLTRVKKLGPLRLIVNGQDLGDIDVLGIDERRRTLWLIECKNLALARTPWELHSDVEGFEEPGKGMIAKHRRRSDWVEANLAAVVAELDLDPGRWRVAPIIVVRADLLAIYLRPMSMHVLHAKDMASHVTGQRPRAARSDSATGVINLAIRPRRGRRR
jgi:hypothetical protein